MAPEQKELITLSKTTITHTIDINGLIIASLILALGLVGAADPAALWGFLGYGL